MRKSDRRLAMVPLLVFAWLALATHPPQALGQPKPIKANQGNRLAYLDECDPYYVGRTFPKLTTPMWVGDKGVEAVVILAIDDMKDAKKYEAFLRPILNRLKKIDGRAPVSIMTNQIDTKEPQLQTWLKEGVSLECHTFDHPCPFFKGGSFAKAKETYDKCVDLMAEIPGNKPVSFRMPCCDSLNTPSPRFWTEMFNKVTDKGNFLTIDSSVFHLFTADDPDLPRELVLEKDGSEKFRKYLPADRTFVNTIENYPYPYVIDRLCWEFPCMTPSDWQAHHLHKSNNPQTVADWKCALDATVIKQGVMTMVFHPHGWIKNDQLVDLIDYAVEKYGKKVKFLNFREAEERLNKNLLAGQPLRDPKTGKDNGARLLDVDNDGYLDVIVGNKNVANTRIWLPKEQGWRKEEWPNGLHPVSVAESPKGVHFGIMSPKGFPSVLVRSKLSQFSYGFDGKEWVGTGGLFDDAFFKGLPIQDQIAGGGLPFQLIHLRDLDPGVRMLDLDGDGICELIIGHAADAHWMTTWSEKQAVYKWSVQQKRWEKLPFTLPNEVAIVDAKGTDNGVRFIDINEDGHLDVVFSNENEYGVYLFKDMKTGWSEKVIAGKAGDKGALPPIALKGTDNGMWVHSHSLWWSNESTALLKDHVDRVSFKELLEKAKGQ